MSATSSGGVAEGPDSPRCSARSSVSAALGPCVFVPLGRQASASDPGVSSGWGANVSTLGDVVAPVMITRRGGSNSRSSWRSRATSDYRSRDSGTGRSSSGGHGSQIYVRMSICSPRARRTGGCEGSSGKRIMVVHRMESDRIELKCPCGFVFVSSDEHRLLALARLHLTRGQCDPRRDPPFHGMSDEDALREIAARGTKSSVGQAAREPTSSRASSSAVGISRLR